VENLIEYDALNDVFENSKNIIIGFYPKKPSGVISNWSYTNIRKYFRWLCGGSQNLPEIILNYDTQLIIQGLDFIFFSIRLVE
jgi:hypothetical protein